MRFEYVQNHIMLRVLDERSAEAVLDFYDRNRENFEPFEIDKPDNFYTIPFQRRLLHAEYESFIHGKQMRFFLFDTDEPEQIIGTVSFFNLKRQNFQSCEIGYKIDTTCQNHGYATRMLTLAIQILSNELGIHRFSAYILPENTASIQLVKKLHFELEGIARDFVYLHDKWQDHFCYSYLANPYSIQ